MSKLYRGEGVARYKKFYVNTGIKRNPKKGEYFLSGAIATAYLAPNDLSSSYYIAREAVHHETHCPHCGQFLNCNVVSF